MNTRDPHQRSMDKIISACHALTDVEISTGFQPAYLRLNHHDSQTFYRWHVLDGMGSIPGQKMVQTFDEFVDDLEIRIVTFYGTRIKLSQAPRCPTCGRPKE